MIAARNEQDVIEAVRHARAARRTLEIAGAGTKRNYGRVAPCDDVLDVLGLRGVVNYEPAELILTVLPGTPVAEIAALLAAKNQRLGFEPADWGPLLGAPSHSATVGGVLSADVNGSAAVRYGRARDSLLGFRAVNGFGEAYKAGGRVVKNVTGFDLPKLVCGAMGTLGVLTEVTLRLFPKPAHSVTLAARDMAPGEGLALLRRFWQSPLEATGLAYADGAAFIRLEGAHEPLKEKIAAAREIAPHLEESSDSKIFEEVANGSVFLSNALNIWRAFVPPSEAARIAQASGAQLWRADWAGGLLWIGLDSRDDGAKLRDLCGAVGGHATLLRAPAPLRSKFDVFTPEDAPRAALTKSVKAAFDPLGIFNPGRMWSGV
ncbi:MAG: FAD-binding protein [Rhizomicrobium sp.]